MDSNGFWRMARRFAAICGIALALGACGGGQNATGSPCPTPPSSCDVPSQNAWLYSLMKDLYFWSGHVPSVDPAAFASPAALMAAVTYQPQDRWSYVTDVASYVSLFSAGQYLGYGFSYKKGSDGLWRLAMVYPDSSAGRAGLGRGYVINSLGGVPIAQVEAQNLWDQVFKDATAGVTMSMDYTSRDGVQATVNLVKGTVTIPPVLKSGVIQSGGKKVAYLNFSSFNATTAPALEDFFAGFRAAGAEALVIDLRYNGGGLIDVANRLADLAADAGADGRVFVRFRHNAAHSGLDHVSRIIRRTAWAVPSLPVAVIATSSTASASELVINGLKPYMDVAVVGGATHGKPTGMYGCYFCGQVASPVAFESVNGAGQGGYYAGIPADCAAADDLGRDFGDVSEDSLREALYRVVKGRCSGGGLAKPRATAAAAASPPLTGLGMEAGAW